MFTHAIDVATKFTNPFVGLRRRANGEVFTTMGAFIAVNSEGWVLTSGHIVEEIVARKNGADGSARRDEGDERVIAHSEVWAVPGFMAMPPRLVEVHVNHVADLGLCRIEPFDAEAISSYPVFRDVAFAPIEQGMSVCRLGFPFCDVPATYHEDRDEFALDDRAFPVPRFALDGIVARFNRRVTEDGAASALFIETSTPGLRGQSGGPLLDTTGRVCGIQSHTSHVDLGFDAQYSCDGGTVTERQFLNVGAATHVDEVRALLDSAGVGYRLG
jgi:hypothetical protein